MSDVHAGGCLCGAVLYTVSGPLRGVVYCHCTQCRRQTGHIYAATNVADDRIEIDGADNLTWYAASNLAHRGFCRICGSALFWKPDDGGHISIMAGTFDTPSGLESESHIFVADKGDYYEISDGLAQYAGPGPSSAASGR
ncbi:GFA family protein [Mesorhizobium xinjiangense]|uniref:GFA family protein n=1 Tax=Mesorhizobium xinjiangense TaxID=2678685 RepID=UPI0012EE23AB|nr:GFA family protein [Mesorhizobium xinjiangense]